MDDISLLPPPSGHDAEGVTLTTPPADNDTPELKLPIPELYASPTTKRQRRMPAISETRKPMQRAPTKQRGPFIKRPLSENPTPDPRPLPIIPDQEPMDFELETQQEELEAQNAYQTSDTPSDYAMYVDAALESAIAFYQICETIFIVQGWNSRSKSGAVSFRLVRSHPQEQ